MLHSVLPGSPDDCGKLCDSSGSFHIIPEEWTEGADEMREAKNWSILSDSP